MDSFRSAGLTDGHGICGLQFLTITIINDLGCGIAIIMND